MAGKIPDPPETPRPGQHARVDVASLAERAKDEAHDAKKIAMHSDDRAQEALQLSKKHAEMIELLPEMKAQLTLALAPIQIRTRDRIPMYAAAAALVVIAAAVAFATIVMFGRAPVAHAVQSVSGTQAVYMMPQ